MRNESDEWPVAGGGRLGVRRGNNTVSYDRVRAEPFRNS